MASFLFPHCPTAWDTSRLSKTRKLLDLQEELHILDRDIHHVESRQFALPASAPGLLALPDLPSPRLQRQTPPGPSNPRQLGLTMEAAPRGAGGAVKEDMDLGRPQINGTTATSEIRFISASDI